jgi:MOSC domain-containing protein YiiM
MYQDSISTLTQQFPVNGELVWIGIRPARKQIMLSVEEILVDCQRGLIGDHYAGSSGKRQLTLFQWEHLAVLESFVGENITPGMLRRNLVIRGINLTSLKKQTFQIGSAVFKTTGLCHPCSRMETVLGLGGYNAMRNHGGITAQIIQSGQIKIGDELSVLQPENE